jgi:glycerophosphoryl diester phosphodiesterase
MKWGYALILSLIILQFCYMHTFASRPVQFDPRFITAHRGSSATAPENTLPAIRQAIRDRAGMVEIDVRLTADGVAVLSHDDNLKRTAGINLYISRTNYEDLKQIDVSYQFPRRFHDARIPTLEEALAEAKGFLAVNIELKGDPEPRGLAAEVVRLLESTEMMDDAVVTSFDRSLLEDVRALTDRLKTGLIIGNSRQLTDDVFTDAAIDILSLRASLITPEVMAKARKNNRIVYAWTVNNRQLMKEMVRYQVDSIITDRPAMLYSLLR